MQGSVSKGGDDAGNGMLREPCVSDLLSNEPWVAAVVSVGSFLTLVDSRLGGREPALILCEVVILALIPICLLELDDNTDLDIILKLGGLSGRKGGDRHCKCSREGRGAVGVPFLSLRILADFLLRRSFSK